MNTEYLNPEYQRALKELALVPRTPEIFLDRPRVMEKVEALLKLHDFDTHYVERIQWLQCPDGVQYNYSFEDNIWHAVDDPEGYEYETSSFIEFVCKEILPKYAPHLIYEVLACACLFTESNELTLPDRYSFQIAQMEEQKKIEDEHRANLGYPEFSIDPHLEDSLYWAIYESDH